MSVETRSREWVVREQIVEDPTSGLTFQFELSPEGRPVLRVFGDALPFGNREVHFDSFGWEEMAETQLGACRTGPEE